MLIDNLIVKPGTINRTFTSITKNSTPQSTATLLGKLSAKSKPMIDTIKDPISE